jgi:hypothetical protein
LAEKVSREPQPGDQSEKFTIGEEQSQISFNSGHSEEKTSELTTGINR